MKTDYILQHSYEEGKEGEFDETKLIGIYSSKENAEKTIDHYKTLPGFKDYPVSCFHVDKYEIDKDQWIEGFIKSDEVV